ncbi:MAG: hypothetical protein AB1405_03725 [Bdellovibrionota bacterium]
MGKSREITPEKVPGSIRIAGRLYTIEDLEQILARLGHQMNARQRERFEAVIKEGSAAKAALRIDPAGHLSGKYVHQTLEEFISHRAAEIYSFSKRPPVPALQYRWSGSSGDGLMLRAGPVKIALRRRDRENYSDGYEIREEIIHPSNSLVRFLVAGFMGKTVEEAVAKTEAMAAFIWGMIYASTADTLASNFLAISKRGGDRTQKSAQAKVA